MQSIKQNLVVALVAACATASVFATPRTSYTTTVKLNDGKTVTCAVNEPMQTDETGHSTLTRRERTEAEVDAIARLSTRDRNMNMYPSPGTAPHVECS